MSTNYVARAYPHEISLAGSIPKTFLAFGPTSSSIQSFIQKRGKVHETIQKNGSLGADDVEVSRKSGRLCEVLAK